MNEIAMTQTELTVEDKAQDVMINKFNRELFPPKETKEVEENDNN